MKKVYAIGLAAMLVFLIQCQEEKAPLPISDDIRLNQIGYYPESTKEFILADQIASTFTIRNTTYEIVFEGKLTDRGTWEKSGEKATEQ